MRPESRKGTAPQTPNAKKSSMRPPGRAKRLLLEDKSLKATAMETLTLYLQGNGSAPKEIHVKSALGVLKAADRDAECDALIRRLAKEAPSQKIREIAEGITGKQ